MATVVQVALGAVTLSVFLYPFVFHAFGKHDNPFEQPQELVSIALLAIVSLATLIVVAIVRRIVLPHIRHH